jgi:hypothetical protein
MTNDRHQQKPYPLRMPAELREALEETAKSNGRSVNAEIVARLQESLTPEAPLIDFDIRTLDPRMQELIGQLNQSTVDLRDALKVLDPARAKNKKSSG